MNTIEIKGCNMSGKMTKSDDEWRRQLSDEEFHVCRQKGTERPFTGKYYQCDETGAFNCVCCDNPLFHSNAKFESGSGWPSFWEPVSEDAVTRIEDFSHGMQRIEVVCSNCGSHLGHVFPDGPQPTGLRYCINSVSLDLDVDE